MSEEWLLSQVILRLGGPKHVLSMFPKDAIASVDTGMKITSIPPQCLAHVLSYIALGDVRNVWSTCKAFAHAIVHYRHFWKRLIESAMEEVMNFSDAKNDKQLSAFLRSVNVFESFAGVQLMLRDHLEWMFKQKHWRYDEWVVCAEIDAHVFVFQRKTAEGKWFTIKQNPESIECFWSWFKRGVGLPNCVFKSTRYDAVFYGNLQLETHDRFLRKLLNLAPDGKWVFGNGMVLEGKGVVYQNQPVFRVDFEEWNAVLKKRRVEEESPPPPPRSGGGGGGGEEE